jgi:hypothetical protein
LFSRLPIQLLCLRWIRLRTPAIGECDAKFVLRAGHSLRRCLAPPVHRKLIVLLHAKTTGVEVSHQELREGIAFVGKGGDHRQHLLVVACLPVSEGGGNCGGVDGDS